MLNWPWMDEKGFDRGRLTFFYYSVYFSCVRYEVEIYSDEKGRSPFIEWMAKIAAVDERRIRKRILRIETGNLGDYKSVGEGVFELRFFFGSLHHFMNPAKSFL